MVEKKIIEFNPEKAIREGEENSMRVFREAMPFIIMAVNIKDEKECLQVQEYYNKAIAEDRFQTAYYYYYQCLHILFRRGINRPWYRRLFGL